MSAAFPTPCIEFAPPLAHCRAMNTSWKTILPAALGAAWLGMAADARENPATGGRPLTILVLDYAGVADSSLDEMETLSTVLLARAGIGTQWVHCLGHGQGPRPALCDANLDAGLVLLRIQVTCPGKRTRVGDPLGAAVVESGYASVFVSEIRQKADHNGLPFGSLMGYAAAHEIGHLLLGSGHSALGIMQALWKKADYRDMAQRWLGFNEAERQALPRAVPGPGQRVAGLK
jgi:hypothetical protein